MDAYLERIFIETLKDGDFQDVDLSADNGTDGFLGGGTKVLPQLSAIGAAARVARDFDANFPSVGEHPLPAIFVGHFNRVGAEGHSVTT